MTDLETDQLSRGRSRTGWLLEVSDLRTHFATDAGIVKAVDGVSFHIDRGEVLALVGESGSGKSVTSLSIMRLLQSPPARYAGGEIFLEDRNLLQLSEAEMQEVRGNEISMIFQEPMTSLNPVFTIGNQIAETIIRHESKSYAQALRLAGDMLDLVGIPDPARCIASYPHQLSGGMRQRVMIAMALSCSPKLLIADEPTTALDVTVQAQILDVMRRLQHELGTAILFITHDLGVVAEMADRVIVMYAGRVVEEAPVASLFAAPKMPYTLALLRAIPSGGGDNPAQTRLEAIPGIVPNPLRTPAGCAFHPRCRYATADCKEDVPALVDIGEGRKSRCLHWESLETPPVRTDARSSAAHPEVVAREERAAGPMQPPSDFLLEVTDLRKWFPLRGGKSVRAVQDVSLGIRRGEVVGLVGESGSGKTTVGRMILRLMDPTAGSIKFDGTDITRLSRRELQPYRRRMQLIFQDPVGSLDPRMTVARIVGEPFDIHGHVRGPEKRERVASLLEKVGLSADLMERRPHEFSGGQRQRISIARALALAPEFIVADEPVSALDVSIQAQIINLLQDLKDDLGLTMLFIAHNLSVIEHISDRVIVMYLGKIMEVAPRRDLYANPVHPYTESLLSAAPIPDPGARRDRIILKGDIPSPTDPPSGCVFRTRCPIAASECANVEPPLEQIAPGHYKACIRRP